jgi:hypothetical protein
MPYTISERGSSWYRRLLPVSVTSVPVSMGSSVHARCEPVKALYETVVPETEIEP